jgi:hypothetical protein
MRWAWGELQALCSRRLLVKQQQLPSLEPQQLLQLMQLLRTMSAAQQ